MTEQAKWYYRKGFVFLLIALIGPLALPLLCKSPVFSTQGKWFWAILVSGMTLLFVFFAGQWTSSLQQQLNLIQQMNP